MINRKDFYIKYRFRVVLLIIGGSFFFIVPNPNLIPFSFIPLLFIFLLLGYHIVLHENQIHEKIFSILLRSVNLGQVTSIAADLSPLWPIRGGADVGLITKVPFLRGGFKYRYFPFFYIDPKFFDEVILRKPDLKVDQYLADVLSEASRIKQKLTLKATDKVGRIVGNVLYIILYLIIAIILLIPAIGLVAELFKN